jgi:hypothetical protein
LYSVQAKAAEPSEMPRKQALFRVSWVVYKKGQYAFEDQGRHQTPVTSETLVS